MARQIIIGITCEGATDYRFLGSVIKRTFESFAYDCKGEIEFLDVQEIFIEKSDFPTYLKNAALTAHENYGVSILGIHLDADNRSLSTIFESQIIPAIESLNQEKNEYCENILGIVPVTMTEAWMLADEEVFTAEIGTNMTYSQLSINNHLESIRDPKETIQQAIQIAYKNHPKRRRRPKIGELYRPIGNKVRINQLNKLSSYQYFFQSVKEMLIKLNFLED